MAASRTSEQNSRMEASADREELSLLQDIRELLRVQNTILFHMASATEEENYVLLSRMNRAGVSQADMAKLLGVSKQAVNQNLKRGASNAKRRR
jgi:hypothetical protein